MLEKISVKNNALSLLWQDGSTDAFSPDWLLDNAPVLKYNSGQKAYSILDIPECLEIKVARQVGDSISVEFSEEKQNISFPLNALKGRSQAMISDRSEQAKELWTGSSLKELPCYSWNEFSTVDTTRREALETFLRLGVFLLKDVPCRGGQVLKVIESFGFVRETNYGELFNVQSAIDPDNQAFTRLGLNQHTDNPYRDPVPTIQLLHCLKNTAEGGNGFLLDGFLAAKRLRDEHPDAFSVLSQYDIPFRYEDRNAVLQSIVRLIETGSRGDIRKVRYNDRSIASVNLPLKEQQDFYPSYRRWAETLGSEDLRISYRLNPGDVVVFDNTRVMHGRTAYTAAGERHLQGAYSDLDGLYSTLYTLRKQQLSSQQPSQ